MDIADIIAQSSRKPTKRLSIRIVADEHCPECGRVGSPKVCDEQGRWHWKCLSTREQCSIAYYLPGTDYIEYKLDEAAEQAQAARIKADIDEMMSKSRWISQGNCSRCIPKDAPLPAGWTEGTGGF